jgi:hypothetical protein
MVSGIGSGQGQRGRQQLQDLIFFAPAEVSVLLRHDVADDAPLPSEPDAPDPRTDEVNKAALNILGETRITVNDNAPFARTYGRGVREPVFFKTSDGTFVFQTINLQEWVPDPGSLHGRELRERVTIVNERVDRLNQMRGVSDGPYTLEAASQNWLSLPFSNGTDF